MNIFSAGQVAELLGVKRDALQAAHRSGLAEPALRAGRRRIYTEDDVSAARRFFLARGVAIGDSP